TRRASPERCRPSDSLLARVLAVPAHRLPTGVFADPLCDVGLRAGRALAQRPAVHELEMPVFAQARLRHRAHRQNKLDHVDLCLSPFLQRGATKSSSGLVSRFRSSPSLPHAPERTSESKDTSNSMILVPL